MKIYCLSITEYKKCPITILHFNYSFFYLFVHKGKFYFDRHDASADFLNVIKWRLGFWKYPYSKDEIIKIKETMLNGAIRSIDELSK